MLESNSIKLRSEIDDKFKWNIAKIYSNNENWQKDFEQLKSQSVKFTDYLGKLNDGIKLLEFLKLDEKLSRLADNLFVFAHLRSDEDTSNAEFQVLKDSIDSFLAKFRSYKAFFVPEILSLPDGTIEKLMKEVPELNNYKFLFDNILRAKPHTLSKEEEKLLSAVSDCLEAPGNIYGVFTNADMTFPKIKNENGEEVELTEVNYSNFIRSKNRGVREEAFNALFNTYGKFKNTFAQTLTSSIKNFIFTSKMKKYNSSLEYSLKPNDISLKVYDNAIETINKNVKLLHRYVDIKKKLLGLDSIHMYDLYVPIIEIEDMKVDFNAGVDLSLKALKPLGEEYLEIFKSGIKDGWIDIYPNKGKRGGAYSWGCYETMPYVLLNYNNEIGDVSTLVHEMGHSIHSYYSRKNQPYYYADYTLFTAEIASTTNECLFIKYLIDNEQDKKKKLYFINQQLEQIRTTVFRQMMFAEFEKITHESLENGKPLTSKDLCNIWHELNVKYFGPSMVVDEAIDMEWARIPHFYSDFYVYQYATGYSAANCFSNMILEEGEKAVENYKNFLKSGGCDYPINILKKAGIDMTTPKPMEETMKTFSLLLDELEKII